MADALISIEVAYATAEQQAIIPVDLAEGATIEYAIKVSGVLEQFPEIDLSLCKVGVFGKVCQLRQTVQADDRVEIYRPLLINPMDARRNRAVKP